MTETAPAASVDLNCDLGEGFGVWRLGDDAALLELVTSANIACGFHAGDPSTMRRTCEHAVWSGATIGAHVGYRDLAGFGRRHIDIAPAELVNDIVYQIGALDGFARMAGSRVRYVKPHGALYHAAAADAGTAVAVVESVRHYDPTLPLLGPPGSELLRWAESAELAGVAEGFADRAYTSDGRLLPRQHDGAVLDDVESIAERCVRMATEGKVDSVSGDSVVLGARSICVHGDTPRAVEIARRVRRALIDAGVTVASFTW